MADNAALNPNSRTCGIAAVVEGFFAFVWFGWGQAAAPSWMAIPLGVGSAIGAVVALTGAAIAVHAEGEHTPMQDARRRRRYLIIVGLEFGLLGVGAAVLGALGYPDWITVWICLGVGVHFFPLASVLLMRRLIPAGLAICAVGIAALVVGIATSVAPTTITGPGTGLCLLIAAAVTLGHAGRQRNLRRSPMTVK